MEEQAQQFPQLPDYLIDIYYQIFTSIDAIDDAILPRDIKSLLKYETVCQYDSIQTENQVELFKFTTKFRGMFYNDHNYAMRLTNKIYECANFYPDILVDFLEKYNHAYAFTAAMMTKNESLLKSIGSKCTDLHVFNRIHIPLFMSSLSVNKSVSNDIMIIALKSGGLHCGAINPLWDLYIHNGDKQVFNLLRVFLKQHNIPFPYSYLLKRVLLEHLYDHYPVYSHLITVIVNACDSDIQITLPQPELIQVLSKLVQTVYKNDTDNSLVDNALILLQHLMNKILKTIDVLNPIWKSKIPADAQQTEYSKLTPCFTYVVDKSFDNIKTNYFN